MEKGNNLPEKRKDLKTFKYYPRRVKTRSGGATYRKRRESSLLTECLKLLKFHENLGHIRWCDRLNSGTLYIPRDRKAQKIQLCREGTPDAYFIRKRGGIVFLETKYTTDLSDSQKDFIKRLDGTPHTHYVIRDVDTLRQILKCFGIEE